MTGSIKDPTVTDAMLNAGLRAFNANKGVNCPQVSVRAIYTAMEATRTATNRASEGDGLVEQVAQWLHDETDDPEAFPDYAWPEHPNDTGQRGDAWVKLVPKDVQSRFREVAKRLCAWLSAALTAKSDPEATRTELVEALTEARTYVEHSANRFHVTDVLARIDALLSREQAGGAP